jgi:hypothetical protein
LVVGGLKGNARARSGILKKNGIDFNPIFNDKTLPINKKYINKVYTQLNYAFSSVKII